MAGRITQYTCHSMKRNAYDTNSYFAEILHLLGLTKSSKLTEVQKGDLIGQFIGETEKVTRTVIQRSRRGALFVDEAYRLTPPDNPKDYGRCALDELMREMDNHDPVYDICRVSKRNGLVLHVQRWSL